MNDTAPAHIFEQGLKAVRKYITGKRKQIHNVDAWCWYEVKSPPDNWDKSECVNLSISVLEKIAKEHKITHLVLSGQMPPDLHRLVPDLTHLAINSLQLEEHPKLDWYLFNNSQHFFCDIK